MSLVISLGNKKIGAGEPVFIIAEAGVNHNGKLALAKKLIDAAAKAGADAVKFQTFSPDELVTKNAAKAEYQVSSEGRRERFLLPKTRLAAKRAAAFPPHQSRLGTGHALRKGEPKAGESQYEMLKRLMLPRAWHQTLKRHAEKKGLVFLSTPFSLDDALFLKRLGVSAIKVSSSDANNLPYLRRIARWRLPILLSTGMADLKEVRESVAVIRRAGHRVLALLQCTTNYPTPFPEVNLRAIQTLQKEFAVPVGFSDHTTGSEAAVAAVALGACVIEKHLTLDKDMSGPDHKASLEPRELSDFVRRIRHVEQALGSGKRAPFESERAIARAARKSIAALRDVKKGERFTEKNLGIKRPGTGLPPKYYETLVGKRAARDIPADALLTRHDYIA
ncbi:MAG: N-acetylneuraminate synthase family protein [Patescibacteria group bacterium]